MPTSLHNCGVASSIVIAALLQTQEPGIMLADRRFRLMPNRSLFMAVLLCLAVVLPATAQENDLDNSCPSELLKTTHGPEYQCRPGPEGTAAEKWRAPLSEGKAITASSILADDGMVYVGLSIGRYALCHKS